MKNALNSPHADRKAGLLFWLAEERRFAPDTGGLLEMLCEKLAAFGVQIARATVHVRTLHPEFRGIDSDPTKLIEVVEIGKQQSYSNTSPSISGYDFWKRQ